MNNKNDVIQIFGILMKNPLLLSKIDKYNLTLSDFSSKFEKYIFDAINGLYHNGATNISIIEIENYLSTNLVAKNYYNDNNGKEYLQDALDFSKEENFDYYYNHLKKINAIESLKKIGVDTKEFYCEDLTSPKAIEINEIFEKLTVNEIFEKVKKNVLKVEQKFLQNDVSETKNIADGIDELIESAESKEDIGLPIQGKIINEIMSGARKGTFCLRSGGSGLGKSRNMVADACFLAFPFRYDNFSGKWEQKGSSEKVLYITTEQTRKEIQRMILAYLTGINESRFRYGNFSESEKKIIEQAKSIIIKYQDNFQITQMPNPTNELIKNSVRENCILYNIDYVFYDYIFIGPALLSEFKGFGLRSDELLLILSTTLKDLAAELNVFVMSGTQVSAKAEDNKEIRNESSLAGGRATINKADYGFIMARPTKEEITVLEPLIVKYGKEPNLVSDVFKVRAGQWTQVRIWSYFDLGILRKEDLFLTNNRLEFVDVSNSFELIYNQWDDEDYFELQNELNILNESFNSVDNKNRIVNLLERL